MDLQLLTWNILDSLFFDSINFYQFTKSHGFHLWTVLLLYLSSMLYNKMLASSLQPLGIIYYAKSSRFWPCVGMLNQTQASMNCFQIWIRFSGIAMGQLGLRIRSS